MCVCAHVSVHVCVCAHMCIQKVDTLLRKKKQDGQQGTVPIFRVRKLL